MDIAGAVVIVTGASGGIGRAAAVALAQRGSRLVLSGRSVGRLDSVAAATGGLPIRGDLTAPGALPRLMQVAESEVGPVDAVVHGAGSGRSAALGEHSAAETRELLDLNLRVPIELTRLALPGMIRRHRGSMVFVGSIAGLVGVRDESVYAAAKGGLAAFADSLTDELRGSRVHVALVAPGAVATDFFIRSGRVYERSVPAAIPPEKVASAVIEAVAGGRRRVVLPRWLNLAVRLHDAAPSVYRSLSGRFG
ncbi:MAG: SDR family NAD(P)-dependent oxidoreductase [Mycobacteriales bacterium]